MQKAQVYKAYKAEFTLGLIGAILTIHTFLFSFGAFDTGSDALAAFNVLFSAAALVLGFVGAAQLNKNNRNGGALLTVAGGLTVFAAIFTAVLLSNLSGYDVDASDSLGFALFHAIIVIGLLLPGGIMALVRKRPAPPAGMAAYPWPSPGSYPGQTYSHPPYAAGMPYTAPPGVPPQAPPPYGRPNPQGTPAPYPPAAPYVPPQVPYAPPPAASQPQSPAGATPPSSQPYDKGYPPGHYPKNP
ncbi:MAG: DUF4064 domain-containing protein [Bacillota bacterium]